jgi:biopolymer transport protein ExbB
MSYSSFMGAGRMRWYGGSGVAAACLALALLVSSGPLEAQSNQPAPTPPSAPAAKQTPEATPPAAKAQPEVAPTPPVAAPSADPAAQPRVGTVNLPRDLSPWSMFMSADRIVQSVMVGLVFASFVTWTVWLAKSVELFLARRRLSAALAIMGRERTLADAAEQAGSKSRVILALIDAAALEMRMSFDVTDRDGVKARVASRLQRIEVAFARDMNKGTGLLATIGSTAPFVGLFGTVWGIMNSFIGISRAQTTNLAVVAPGIAEALLATAIGLFAAIPAVIIYNQFARSIGAYRALLGDASAEVLRLVSRDLDRGIARSELARAAE